MKKVIFAICIVLLTCTANTQNLKTIYRDTTFIELITFETDASYFRQGTPTTNCWQIGEPGSPFFESAYSEPNAIVTDTINSYPANNHSWFDLIIPEYPFVDYIGISFYHKLNTEKNKDGGFITISYDMGKTWINIIEDNSGIFATSPATEFDYYTETEGLYSLSDTLFNGEHGFSGDVTTWSKVRFNWVKYIAVKKKQFIDTVIIRFNFISDSVNNLEGWMIDDINLFTIDLPGAVDNSLANSDITVSPNPIKNTTVIQSKNKQTIKTLEVFSINGQLVRTEHPNSDQFVFEKKDLNKGIYFIRCLYSKDKQESLKIIIE